MSWTIGKRGLALAAMSLFALATVATPASASIETPEAKAAAGDAAALARSHRQEVFGEKPIKNGQFRWREGAVQGPPVLVISLADQLAYLYRGGSLVAVSTISTGTEKNPTPTGIFTILDKQLMYRSIKYDNAPMPYMQRIDDYGIALHAGHLPGYAASHGCIRLPALFAARLFSITSLGSTVVIGT